MEIVLQEARDASSPGPIRRTSVAFQARTSTLEPGHGRFLRCVPLQAKRLRYDQLDAPGGARTPREDSSRVRSISWRVTFDVVRDDRRFRIVGDDRDTLTTSSLAPSA